MSIVYAKFLFHMEEMINKQYEISSTIKHRGEKGRKREEGLGQFLKENLPDKYSVGTGEIFPCEGTFVSPQCDIIIYDKINTPVIGKSGTIQQIPIEGVYAVIEVKSTIDKASLEDAKQKFDAIRALPRQESVTSLVEGKVRGPHFYLFGYNLKTTTERCTDFVKSTMVDEDVTVISLDKGGTIFIDPEQYDDPVVFLLTTGKRANQDRFHYTLGLFLMDLLRTLGDINLGDFDWGTILKPIAYNMDDILGFR